MAIDPATATPTQLDRTLTERGLALVNGKTTDMADSVLRVPLHYYRDPKITEIEESSIFGACRWPSCRAVRSRTITTSSSVPCSAIRCSSPATPRAAHVFLNYCRHRGAMPACGSGNSRRFVCPYHAWNYDTAGKLFRMPGEGGLRQTSTPATTAWSSCPTRNATGSSGRCSPRTPSSISTPISATSAAELDQWNYASYGYHDDRQF